VSPAPRTARRAARVRGRAPAPEGAAAARRAREQSRLESRALAAAEQVFARSGLETTSLTDLARATRTTVRRLTELFTSKERIFAAVLVRHVEELEDRIRRALARKQGLRERLVALLWTRARAAAERRMFSRLLLEGDPSVGAEARRAHARLFAQTRAELTEAVSDGDAREELGAEFLASVVEASFRVYLLERVLAREDEDPTESEAATFVSHLLDGIAPV